MKSLILLGNFLLVLNSAFCAKNPLLLISFDGMRSSVFEKFLNENPNSNFQKFLNTGLKAEYMIPSFPTLTFPNHVTLVTGLYPESHGIINKIVFYPNLNQKVDLSKSNDLKYWNKTEPFWFTAKKSGLKTASSFWVGNNVWPTQPDIFIPYSSTINPFERADELVSWFKKFNLDFACIYFDEPDAIGHLFGPDSSQYYNKIVNVDKILGYLIGRLKIIGLYDKLNILIVGDHGMASLGNDSTINIRDFINMNLVDEEKSTYGVVSNIYPKSNLFLRVLYDSLKVIPQHDVYHKGELSDDFHYLSSDRIGPIIVLSREGFSLTDENVKTLNHGAHGYKKNSPSMRTIFLANGPSFKQGIMRPFKNVNVYPLMCKLLDVICHQNNGSISIFELYLVQNDEKKTPKSVFTFFREFIKTCKSYLSNFFS